MDVEGIVHGTANRKRAILWFAGWLYGIFRALRGFTLSGVEIAFDHEHWMRSWDHRLSS